MRECENPRLSHIQLFDDDEVLKKKELSRKLSFPSTLAWRVLEVRSPGWGYLPLQEREKGFLFLIHTSSSDHCLLFMPPILDGVRVTPLLQRARQRVSLRAGAGGWHCLQPPGPSSRPFCAHFECSQLSGVRTQRHPHASKGLPGWLSVGVFPFLSFFSAPFTFQFDD